MVTDVNWTYYDNHFAVDTNIKLLCFTPETNAIHQLYLNFKKDNAVFH